MPFSGAPPACLTDWTVWGENLWHLPLVLGWAKGFSLRTPARSATFILCSVVMIRFPVCSVSKPVKPGSLYVHPEIIPKLPDYHVKSRERLVSPEFIIRNKVPLKRARCPDFFFMPGIFILGARFAAGILLFAAVMDRNFPNFLPF
eukprot:sb/3473828/